MPVSPPLVLSSIVRTEDEFQFHFGRDATKPPPLRPLSIVSRRAFGVYPPDDADKAVEALHLDTHLADAPALSHLTVQGDGADRMFIRAIDKNLIVLGSCLPTYNSPVYLVYESFEQSITMITARPWSLIPHDKPGLKLDIADAHSVLIVRPSGGDYALVTMAQMDSYSGYGKVDSQDVLYVWGSSSRQWDPIRTSFPSEFKGDSVAHSYKAVLAFACGGHAFWADLLRGVMYCRVDTMLSAAAGGSELQFDFIKLPFEHPCRIPREMYLDLDMFRTIGRSGQSIKFVTVHGFDRLLNFVDCSIKVCSLLPDMKTWARCYLPLGSLVEQDEFKKAGLPTDMVPMYPRLHEEEEDVVYFMLGQYKKCCEAHKGTKNRCNGYVPSAKNPRYHLCVDMRRRVLLAFARLPDLMSPSVSLASTSVVPVVPSTMIRRGSRVRVGTTMMDKQDKRRRGGV